MASGRPVIAYGAGGATETIIPQETGLFFKNQTWESLLDTLLQFNATTWDSAYIREQALTFGVDTFKTTFKKYVEDRYEEFKKGFNQKTLFPTR